MLQRQHEIEKFSHWPGFVFLILNLVDKITIKLRVDHNYVFYPRFLTKQYRATKNERCSKNYFKKSFKNPITREMNFHPKESQKFSILINHSNFFDIT